MSEWREFDKFKVLEWDTDKDCFVPHFDGKITIRKDMVGSFEESLVSKHITTRVFLKFGNLDQVVRCPYPEFFDWVTT